MIWDSLAVRECGTRLVLREITSRHGRDVLRRSPTSLSLNTTLTDVSADRCRTPNRRLNPWRRAAIGDTWSPLHRERLDLPDLRSCTTARWDHSKASYSALRNSLANTTYDEETCCRLRVTKKNLGWSLSLTMMHWHVTLAKLPLAFVGCRVHSRIITLSHTGLLSRSPPTRPGEFLFSRMKVCHLENWLRDRTSPQCRVLRWRNAVPGYRFVASLTPFLLRRGNKGVATRKGDRSNENIIGDMSRIHDTRMYTRIHGRREYTRVLYTH